MRAHKKTTIVFPIRDGEILLGMKKRGFGQGWWNGFGGKLNPGEDYEDSARRETLEEAGVKVGRLIHMADLHFYFDNQLGVVSKAYKTGITDEPSESAEMKPQFFGLNDIPYEQMWPADRLWLSQVLSANDLPLGFIVHFYGDKSFKSIEQVDPDSLREMF